MLKEYDCEETFLLRKKMIEGQIEERGISDQAVLKALLEIPRHIFAGKANEKRAYDDTPLPIGEGQTISQPYMVAWMTSLLELTGTEKVLEIGTGSGYQTAILCLLAKTVYSIEKFESLAAEAEKRLSLIGIDNFRIIVKDGTEGLEEHAPFDSIIVTAGAPGVPEPLMNQLKKGGRLVIPIGTSTLQNLTLVTRKSDGFETKELGGCVFVPLLGKHGWKNGTRKH